MPPFTMSSPSTRMSSSYKNLLTRQKHSPVELKEKLRKSYKEKVHSSRNLIFDSLRGNLCDNNLHNALNDIYRNMFDHSNELVPNEDDQLFEDIKKELVKEELDWWVEEYEKSQNIDLTAIEAENVVCPFCQKDNLFHDKAMNKYICPTCKSTILTDKSLCELNNALLVSLEKHNSMCDKNAFFTSLADPNDDHVYLFCDHCNEMLMVV